MSRFDGGSFLNNRAKNPVLGMYDVLKGDYAKPNGITENRLKKPIMQNHRSEIPNDGFVYPALLDVELNPRFCQGKKIMR